MTAIVTRTFRSGNSEAIRLPREIAFGDGVELVLVRSGDVLTVYPVAATIPAMIEALQALPAPTQPEKRDAEDIPEREGL